MSSNFIFSSRTDWELGSNQLHDVLEDLRAKNKPIIDLTESNPTRCGFRYPSEIIAALHDDENLKYQPDAKGILKARQGVSGYYEALGRKIDPESIVLTSSTSEAYTFLFRLLLNPGDKVLIARPSYPLFQYLIELADAAYDHYPLEFDYGRWRINFNALEGAVGPSTRALILVNPNNPTGSYITANERDQLNLLCARHNLALIVDEVFYDYRLDPEESHGVSFAGNHTVPTFVLNGISKMLALPQMKLSWIAASGPDDAHRKALDRLEMIADTFLSVNTPVQNALGRWLEKRDAIQAMVLERIRLNHKAVEDFCLHHRLEFYPGRGGWYGVIRIPSVKKEEEWVLRLLKDHHVLVHPGYFFDMPQDGFMVMSLLPEEKKMDAGLEAMGKLLKRNP